ncbi:GLPGLI family protein [Flavobacterium sp. RSB2_4_14]|uniref:GLPGLI family protein n=1 Tax=Flavobacterium sp. RSB2_4_14 TaxID=3447665 RepID=UPI003F417DE9
MIKSVLLSLFLLTGFFVNAQEFQGKAEYFSKRIQSKKVEKIDVDGKDKMDAETEKAFQDAIKKASEKQYMLTFNKVECLYEEQEQLDKPEAPTAGGISFKVSFSGEGKKYLNVKEKNSITEDEIFGKEFLIVEPLEKLDWKLGNETKKIGDYTCFKAELLVPVTDKQRKDYEEFLKKEETKPSLFKMEEPKDKTIIAWYTPEIPVSFGPNNYWGLPGLILEINEEDKIILCSKVTLSNKEKAKIKVPNTGEKVSQKKFDEIQKKKMDSMKDEDGNIIFQTTD